MKFSYKLIKKIIPEIKSEKQLVQVLNLYIAEANSLGNGTIDIEIPHNRYSDLASHYGIAQELSAKLDLNWKYPKINLVKNQKLGNFEVEVKDKRLCRRYMAQYFENVKVKQSPKWLRDILAQAGLNSVNNLVDLMNYAMILSGQPLHVFDYDKIETVKFKNQLVKKIIIRRAYQNEKIVTLENETINLDPSVLLIADSKEPLVIAGIKGGKKAEVDKNTKRIIIESAWFDRVNIHQTSKKIRLSTDASNRFSHQLSYYLPQYGLSLANKLLREIGAKPGKLIDKICVRPSKKILTFSVKRFEKLIGISLPVSTICKYLSKLGMKVKRVNNSLKVEVPDLRIDIREFADLAEEVIRVYGYQNLKPQPPISLIQTPKTEEIILFNQKIRDLLTSLGFNEVYNYSFVSKNDLKIKPPETKKPIEIQNPVSEQFAYLRPDLIYGLYKNIKQNLKEFGQVKIFEIGKTFCLENSEAKESWQLGLAIAGTDQPFFELKGLVNWLLRKVGLVKFLLIPKQDYLEIEGDSQKLGYVTGSKQQSFAQINLSKLLKLVKEEISFQPLPKYPSSIRDISILVNKKYKIGKIIEVIQLMKLSNLRDVDLIDEYVSPQIGMENRGLTFRLVFRSKYKTLTKSEVDQDVQKISEMLEKEFGAEIR